MLRCRRISDIEGWFLESGDIRAALWEFGEL